jgi:hypothetical protein
VKNRCVVQPSIRPQTRPSAPTISASHLIVVSEIVRFHTVSPSRSPSGGSGPYQLTFSIPIGKTVWSFSP